MEIAAYALICLASALWIITGLIYSVHRVSAIVLFGFAFLLADISVCLFWAAKTAPTTGRLSDNQTTSFPGFREKLTSATVFVGSNSVEVPLDRLRNGPVGVLTFGKDTVVSLHLKGGAVYVDASVWAGYDVPPIEVKDGEFTVQRLGWDRNFNQTALEVVNEKMLPIFQMVYTSPSTIVVRGLFPSPQGVLMAVDDNGLMYNAKPGPPPYSPKRLFKYPSASHLGELLSN